MTTAATVLLASTPIHAHITPLAAITRALVADGHEVKFLTGAKYADTVRAAGAEFLPLPADADYPDDDFDRDHPGRAGLTGPAALKFDMRNIFLKPVKSQLAAVKRAVAEHGVDVVAYEPLFFGGTAYSLRSTTGRARTIALGIFPLMADDPDVAPAGLGIPPMPGRLGRIRNAVLRFVAQRLVFGDLQRDVDAVFREAVGRPLDRFLMDSGGIADRIAQFTVQPFEYPRPTLRDTVRFLGPVAGRPGSPAPAADLPAWWGDLDGERRVVHVTQGTVANSNFDDLLLPTIRALAGRDDVLVVASTGRRDIRLVTDAFDTVPENLRIAEFLPYDQLLPRTDVMVTNGGYGGVHYALGAGVPLVVAGQTEDKVEVSARIAWSGVGVNLKAQRPTEAAVRAGVDAVLGGPSYREAAERMAVAIAASPGAAGVSAVIDELLGGRRPVG